MVEGVGNIHFAVRTGRDRARPEECCALGRPMVPGEALTPASRDDPNLPRSTMHPKHLVGQRVRSEYDVPFSDDVSQPRFRGVLGLRSSCKRQLLELPRRHIKDVDVARP
jgi:hypothetical protein